MNFEGSKNIIMSLNLIYKCENNLNQYYRFSYLFSIEIFMLHVNKLLCSKKTNKQQ